MYDKKAYFYGTGRRKSSVARVRLYQGTGKITINDRDIDEYFGLETLKLIVRQPLELTETTEKFDIVCRVAGGGAQRDNFIPTGSIQNHVFTLFCSVWVYLKYREFRTVTNT